MQAHKNFGVLESIGLQCLQGLRLMSSNEAERPSEYSPTEQQINFRSFYPFV